MGLPKEEIGNVRRRVTPIRIGAQTEEYGAIILPTPLKVISKNLKTTKKMKERVRAKVTLVHRRGRKGQTRSKTMMTA
jgi:hypothetical protein